MSTYLEGRTREVAAHGLLGVPNEIRPRLYFAAYEAVMNTSDEETGAVDTHAATMQLKHNILSGVHTRMSFTIAPNAITGEVDFEEEDLWTLSDCAWDAFFATQVQTAVQRMKMDLTKQLPEGVDALEDVRHSCYHELVSYTSDEGKVIKFIGRASLDELKAAAQQFAEKRQRAGQRENRLVALIDVMESKGASGETTVVEALGMGPFLQAL